MKEALLDYIDHKLNQEDMGRVFPITFQGKEYFVKRDISNHRSSWIKPSPRAAFDHEFYMMNFVRTQLPLAPEIIGFREHYFVTPNYGKNLTYYAHLPQEHPEDSSLEDLAIHVFYAFGKALGMLHDYGMAHGRPALRDIVYNPDTDDVMLLDWENARRWYEFTPAGWDLLIFIHSFIREGDLPQSYLYAAMNGYSTARCAQETVLHVKEVLHKHDNLFKFCRLLEPFHFVDTEAAVKSFDFIQGLKTE